ncbi:MAG: hypothetical protein Q9208_007071 [Pyrenodesmia sp. 3 TL-2023]
MLLQNSCGIPIHQQHGSLDDNVPPNHSRRLSLLLSRVGCPSEYVELPGRGHYFDGVLTAQSLVDFYTEAPEGGTAGILESSTFEFVAANPASMGSKFGVVVDRLTSPGSLGQINAEYVAAENTWFLHTSNIHRLHLTSDAKDDRSSSVIAIDGNELRLYRDVEMSAQCWSVWTPAHGGNGKALFDPVQQLNAAGLLGRPMVKGPTTWASPRRFECSLSHR